MIKPNDVNFIVEIIKQEYSVSNLCLCPNLVSTPKSVAQKIGVYKEVGLDLLIIQCANMQEGLEVMPLV